MKKLFALLLVLSVTIYSCKKDDEPSPALELEGLPADTGGDHKAHVLGSDAAAYGYYIYTPSGYTVGGPKYPLLIFLHGSGEVGNSQTSAANLDKILVNGPPKLIKAKQWTPKYPMVVASLQCHEGWWDIAKVKSTTEFLMKTYAIDTTRVYMTGLSMGGFGTWDQLTAYGKASHLTAILPISGGGAMSTSKTARAAKIPVWAFHGDADGTVLPAYDKDMYKAVNALNPEVKMKLTIYPGVGHDAWTKTYNNSAKGSAVDAAFDPFDMNVYEWLLQYKKK